MAGLLETKIYHRHLCAVFHKTAKRHGSLSNMAGGYPLRVNGVVIPTAEALYQACRYPHCPDIQATILGQASPIAAKMKSKHFYSETRPDWDTVRVPIMAWCLRLKLAQHWERMSVVLLETGGKPIVEASHRDQFWGAMLVSQDQLHGANVLGCLWTAIRDRHRAAAWSLRQPPSPSGFGVRLLGQSVGDTRYEDGRDALDQPTLPCGD